MKGPKKNINRNKSKGFNFGTLVFLSGMALFAVEGMVMAQGNRLQVGKKLFDQNCAVCHGKYGQGSKTGPPMVHKFYRPGHHGDEAFFRAAKNGVKSHHWGFGDMPPQPQVTEEQVKDIVYFVRVLQKSFGIN